MRLVGLVHAAGPLERLIGKAGKYKGKVDDRQACDAAFVQLAQLSARGWLFRRSVCLGCQRVRSDET